MMKDSESVALTQFADRMTTWKQKLSAVELPFTKYRGEWEKVSEAFQSEDHTLWGKAIEILAGWKLSVLALHSTEPFVAQNKSCFAWRARGEVPVVTDVSEAVLRALYSERMEDSLATGNLPPWITAENLRFIHAMTIIRFVNFVRELGASVLEPMQASSKKQGLPGSIVSLRHAASHDSFIPSLSDYRQGVETCRTWLVEHYWSKPMEDVAGRRSCPANVTPTATDVESIHNILTEFEKDRRNEMTKKKKPKLKRPLMTLHVQRMKRIPSLYTNVLISEGHLVLNPFQRVACNWNIEEMDLGSSPPVILQLFWQPLLSLMKKHGILPSLLTALVTRISSWHLNRGVLLQLSAWTNLMIDAFCENSEEKTSHNSFNWREILRTMLDAPKNFDEARRNKVMKAIKPPLTQSDQEILITAAMLYAGEWQRKDLHFNKGLYTLSQVLDRAEESEIPQHPDVQSPRPYRRWTRDSAYANWDKTPLGLLPGISPNQNDLELRSVQSMKRKFDELL